MRASGTKRIAKRVARPASLACLAGALAGAAALASAVWRLGPPPLEAARAASTSVLDRNGELLRAYTTDDGRWRLPVSAGEVDPRYLALLLAFEDKRFHQHGGVDFRALARAGVQLVTNGRIVSGGSTLTMQTARLLDGPAERGVSTKLAQMLRAWQLEARLTKPQILDLYLRLAPFGGNIEGVRAASLAYLGKEPRRLSIGEAALLVALPQSPEARRPDRSPAAALKARNRVISRAVAAGLVKPVEAERAMSEAVPTVRREFPRLAPHLADAEVSALPERQVHRLTIDAGLQRRLERLAAEHARLVGPRISAAILVADHTTGEVLAHVGSAGFLDRERLGAIDMVAAVRSPGSTLKPIIYGLAFEDGLAHPETLIEDRPARFGAYVPKNFDEGYHGTVTVREALQLSLNIPAVKVLDRVGPGRLLGRMRKAGAEPVLGEEVEPTLAVALGGLGLRLTDLVGLYAALARNGEPVALSVRQRVKAGGPAPGRLLDDVAAWQVSDILKDAPPPVGARAGRIAYKTGTSYGYRDAWAVGYDGRHVVGVWAGRPDGASVPGLTGRTAAAPMLFDAFQRISESRAPLASRPRGAVRVSGADLPPPLKRFGGLEARLTGGPLAEPAVRIAFPPDRTEIEAVAGGTIVLRAEGGALPLTWLADDAPIASSPHRREAAWTPPEEGFVKLTVIDAKGRVDRVVVRLVW